MLTTLPDLTFPITPMQVNGLMDGVQQLNITEAGVDPRTQKALDLKTLPKTFKSLKKKCGMTTVVCISFLELIDDSQIPTVN